jgi:hypothetical protein
VLRQEEEGMSEIDVCIEATCEKGHRQLLQIEGQGREWALTLAGLLDGSSEMYRFPPGPESPIGKCGVCGSQISCEVKEGKD